MQIFIQTMKTRAIKTHTNQRQRYTQFLSQKLFSSWILLKHTSIESHSNLIIRGCLANATPVNTTPVYPYFSISCLIVGSSLDEANSFARLYWQGEKNSTKSYKAKEEQHQQVHLWMKQTPSSICIDEEFNWRFFASSLSIKFIYYHASPKWINFLKKRHC